MVEAEINMETQIYIEKANSKKAIENSKYFHAPTIIRGRSNNIDTIQWGKGELVSGRKKLLFIEDLKEQLQPMNSDSIILDILVAQVV